MLVDGAMSNPGSVFRQLTAQLCYLFRINKNLERLFNAPYGLYAMHFEQLVD